MRRSAKVCQIVLLHAAIISMPAWLVGCASKGEATVRDAEKLIGKYSTTVRESSAKSRSTDAKEFAPDVVAEGPAFAVLPPALGPRTDTSKEHLLDLYQGQQAIIETLEARSGPGHDPGHGDRAERHASDLPEDISQEDLLRILAKQQQLIKALTDRQSSRTRRL